MRLALFRGLFVALMAVLLGGSVCQGKSVTFAAQLLDKAYGDERVAVAIDKVLKDAGDYFSAAEAANLYPFDFNGDVAVVFGGEKVSSSYPIGVLSLTLSEWFRSKTILSVSVDAELYNEYVYGSPNLTVYLYVNGSRSESSVYANSSSQNPRGTLCCGIGSPCDVLEICMAANIKKTTGDSQVMVRSITVEYEGEDPEPLEVDPAVGIDSMSPGQAVKLSGCVIEENGGAYLAHVVKTGADGRPEVLDGRPDTYTVPVVWKGEAQTGFCVNISGTIVEIDSRKYLEADRAEATPPTCAHAPAEIYVNGEPLSSGIIAADDIITLSHPLGQDVRIYYTKRKGVQIDPGSAMADPATVSSSEVRKAPAEASGPDTGDEDGTYLYTGPFRIVHPAGIGNADQDKLTLNVQVHSSPTLTAGAAIAPSEVYALDTPITTGTLSILMPGDATVTYYDLTGRPVPSPRPGQILIRRTTPTATPTKIYSR